MPRKTPAQLDREIDAVLSQNTSEVTALLQRLFTLEEQHLKANEELRAAAREVDRVMVAEERGKVDPARKETAEKWWDKAVGAERALTDQMRPVVLKIRALDPSRVPLGWKNTR